MATPLAEIKLAALQTGSVNTQTTVSWTHLVAPVAGIRSESAARSEQHDVCRRFLLLAADATATAATAADAPPPEREAIRGA